MNDRGSAQSGSAGGRAQSGDAGSRPQEAGEEERREQQRLAERLSHIGRKVLVLSGKGGVGKSTVAVNLAVSLAEAGRRVGLLDVDIHGPSVPTMLRLGGERVLTDDGTMEPVAFGELKVMSIGFLLRDEREAVIWRGPLKMGVIKQFMSDVAWGDLDYLVVDAPPGTGDEPLSVCQLVGGAAEAIIVTTPQEVALVSVRKSVTFCEKLGIRVVGVVENMGGFVCPHCGERSDLFGSGGGERMASEMGVPFLGRIPLDPRVAGAGDAGQPFVLGEASGETARAFARVVGAMLAPEGEPASAPVTKKKETSVRIAIPLAEGKLSAHFGHCERFALLDVDTAARRVLKKEEIPAPEHQPGLLPAWLGERGATVIIAGGMGQRAQDLFTQQKITVVVGAPTQTPEELAAAYLAGTLVAGDNVCDH